MEAGVISAIAALVGVILGATIAVVAIALRR